MTRTNDEVRWSLGIRRVLFLSLALVGTLVIGLGGWAALAEIDGAVISPGTIVVESNSRRIQHLEGGIVHAIWVAEGDRVSAGDLLLQLDPTVVGASLSALTKQLTELRAQEARLNAELYGLEVIDYPEDLLADSDNNLGVAEILNGQIGLKNARRESLEGQKLQILEQIKQLEQQRDGVAIQRDSSAESLAFLDDQIETLAGLVERELALRSDLTTLKRERAVTAGRLGELAAQVAQIGQVISERRIQIILLEDTFRENVQSARQDSRIQISVLRERIAATEDQLARLDIRAPIDGVVHALEIHTVGGVVGAGEVLMSIIPQEDELVVEAQVRLTDIDQVYEGQDASIRVLALDPRGGAMLEGSVIGLSPDVFVDQQTGARYYAARLIFKDGEIASLRGDILVPGMPVEAFMQTGSRTVMSYLVQPLADQISYALRD